MGHITPCNCKGLHSTENVNIDDSDDLKKSTRILTPIIGRHR